MRGRKQALLTFAALGFGALIGMTSGGVTVHAQVAAAAAPPASGAASDTKIWEGVYSAEQSQRGKKVYEAFCTTCHGLNLVGGRQGGQGGPALAGDPFFLNWEGASLGSLLGKIERTMPRESPASLRIEEYVDVTAYILAENKFPAGGAELKRDPTAADAVRIVKKAGAAPVAAPNFALVQVVGCLAQGPNDSWMLTNSTDAAVTKDETLGANELKAGETRALGNGSYRLIGVGHLKPEAHKGHKVQAKGLLNIVPNDTRLDVLALQTVGSTCGN